MQTETFVQQFAEQCFGDTKCSFKIADYNSDNFCSSTLLHSAVNKAAFPWNVSVIPVKGLSEHLYVVILYVHPIRPAVIKDHHVKWPKYIVVTTLK
jgi:hypothetical protein